MWMEYSAKFKEKMVAKMVGPAARSAMALSKETGVPQSNLSRWLRRATLPPMESTKHNSSATGPGKRRRWTIEEKLRVVREAVKVSEVSEVNLGAFLRREGLHQAELERLVEEVEQAARQGLQARQVKRGATAEEKELRALRKELRRKEKALAETAALLVLQKKVNAFLEEQEEGDTDGKSDK
jgi:transposase